MRTTTEPHFWQSPLFRVGLALIAVYQLSQLAMDVVYRTFGI